MKRIKTSGLEQQNRINFEVNCMKPENAKEMQSEIQSECLGRETHKVRNEK